MSVFHVAVLGHVSQYVSEVVIGAPYAVGKDLLDHFKVSCFCLTLNPGNAISLKPRTVTRPNHRLLAVCCI